MSAQHSECRTARGSTRRAPPRTGPAVVVSYVLASIAALLSALSYAGSCARQLLPPWPPLGTRWPPAEQASAGTQPQPLPRRAEFAVDLPVSGGAYNYISLVFGELAAWLCGWNM